MPANDKKKTATRKSTGAPKREHKSTGNHRRVSAEHNAPSRKKRNGRKTVRSSNRIRAARAGEADMVVAGRRNKAEPSVIDADSDKEIFGVQMSERARRGESNPRMPASKVQTTQSREPKKVPRTGIAKARKTR